MREKPVIAIDGPSGVGKSTVAKEVASRLGFILVDTGALYRTVALIADLEGISWDAPEALAAAAGAHAFAFDADGAVMLDGEKVKEAIRTPRMSMGASAVAKHPEVREALLGIQRSLGTNGGVVLEGRDVGTVVFPDAEVKFFLWASAEVRARRRFLELSAKGKVVQFEDVLKDQEARDLADSTRAVAPLKQAEDAIRIECDQMTAFEVANEMLRLAHSRMKP